MKKFQLSTAQTAVIMAALTLGSKFLGFVREAVLANYYGAGMVTDAYKIALSIPNYLLAAAVSAFAAAYMPELARISENSGEKDANSFTSRVINFQLIVSLVVSALGMIFAGPLVKFFAPGFGEESVALAAYYLRASFLLVVFNIFINICGAYMRYKDIFIPELVFGLVHDVCIIAAIVISVRTSNYVLIYGTVAGYMLRAVFGMYYSRRCGFRYSFDTEFGTVIKTVAAMALPIFLGGYVSQFNTMIDRMLASGLVEGSISALDYGNLIVGVIVAITTTILTTIIYPKLNKAFALGQMDRISELCEKSMNIGLLVSVPFTFGALAFGAPLVQIMYERGAFGSAATAMTASAFMWYSLRIAFAAVSGIIVYVFYTLHDTKTPVYCSCASVAVNVVFNLILVRFMAHSGLALATSIAAVVNAVLLWIAFKRKHPEISLLGSSAKLIKIIIFAALSVAVAYILWSAVSAALPGIVSLGLAILAAVGVYLIVLKLSGFEELELLKQLFKHSSAE